MAQETGFEDAGETGVACDHATRAGAAERDSLETCASGDRCERVQARRVLLEHGAQRGEDRAAARVAVSRGQDGVLASVHDDSGFEAEDIAWESTGGPAGRPPRTPHLLCDEIHRAGAGVETAGQVILMPGVAFSKKNGARMGHGAGYYDDYITRHLHYTGKKPLLVGLALKEQLVDDVPVEEHDYTVDCLVSGDGEVTWYGPGPDKTS
ncbi:5,10-methenyltetrahydrofolate synthetase [Kluyveromyces marxianus]|nr:5,10-methenyltetrahydrofolate synthetase [Kluyveromyces marxianus]